MYRPLSAPASVVFRGGELLISACMTGGVGGLELEGSRAYDTSNCLIAVTGAVSGASLRAIVGRSFSGRDSSSALLRKKFLIGSLLPGWK